MEKKIDSWILVASLSLSIGCYTRQAITREQLDGTTREELKSKVEQADITVCTKDSSGYKFLKDNYSIHGDTLTGFGAQTIGGNDRRYRGTIPFADITLLKTEGFDLTKTIIAIAVPVELVAAFLLALAAGMSKI